MDPIAKVMFLMAALLFGVLILARLLDALLRKLFQKSREQSKNWQNHLTEGLQQQLQAELAKRRQAKQEEAVSPVPTVTAQEIQDFAPMREETKVYREPGTLLQDQMETYREAATDALHTANYEQKRRLEEVTIRQQEEAAYLAQAKIPGTQPRRLHVQLTPEKMREAVILSEILGKPKAYRRRRH